MKKIYLDIYTDYSARFLVNQNPVSFQNLPISDKLQQRIQAWDNNCFLEFYENSDVWWNNHVKEEFEIAKTLQNELPNMTVRCYYHTGFVELDKIAYEIKIIDGFESGGNFWVAPTIANEINDSDFYFAKIEHSKRNGITLDEDFSFPYVYFFLKHYFDFSIQGRRDCICDDGLIIPAEQGFDHYDVNFYTYQHIEKMLRDMRETIHLLLNNYASKKLNDWKAFIKLSKFDYLFLDKFKINWSLLSDKEQDQFIEENRYVFIDFYFRFISKIEIMMKNHPQFDLIYFAGP